jgi:allantoin racemase
MKIWYQSALDLHARASNYRDTLAKHFERVKSPGTEVILRGRGAVAEEVPMADIIGSPVLYHKAITPVFIDAVLEAERVGADAFVIGTFSEPIVPELRSLANIPVITMPEASMLLACSVAPKFALVTLSRVAVSYMYKTIAAHKLGERVSGVYVVDEFMEEEDLDKEFGTPGPYLERFREACRVAIRDGAQAILPAEGMMASVIVSNGVTEVDGAPVVDPIAAPILFAELAVRMQARTGGFQSRIAYPRPSAAGMRAIFGAAK